VIVDEKWEIHAAYLADTRYAHVVSSGVAWSSIFGDVKRVNHRVFFVGAVELAWVVCVEERVPREVLSTD
jgi:hypothetical protein